MSYGYQGSPFGGGNAPPTSFGVPPGTPSAPHAPSFGRSPGFEVPFDSPRMPQPYGGYEHPQPRPPLSFGGYENRQPHPPQLYGGYENRHPYPPQNYGEYENRQPYPPQPYGGYENHPSCPPQSRIPRESSPPYPGIDVGANSSSPFCRPTSSSFSTLDSESHPYPPNAGYRFAGGACDPRAAYQGWQGPSPSFPCTGSTAVAPPRHGSRAPPATNFVEKLSPTVVPCADFDSREDAEVLRKAMKGFGTDEKAIIGVLANRSNSQRQEIATQFKTLYGKDLVKDLKSETSGKFEDLLVAMMTPLPQYYASELHEAMAGVGTDETALIQVLCTMSNHEIRTIRQAYESMYGKSLEDDLRSDTSGNFKRLMVSLSCANRDESFNVDPHEAMEDAKRLLQAGELQFGTDESVFNAILVQRNVPQLRQIFMEYEKITGHGIEIAIANEFSGDIEKGLLAIVKCVKDRADFFAELLHASMKGLGTDDRLLIRLMVTRSEIDLGEIKQAFLRRYGQSLENFISDDCTGHYKKCLLAIAL